MAKKTTCFGQFLLVFDEWTTVKFEFSEAKLEMKIFDPPSFFVWRYM